MQLALKTVTLGHGAANAMARVDASAIQGGGQTARRQACEAGDKCLR